MRRQEVDLITATVAGCDVQDLAEQKPERAAFLALLVGGRAGVRGWNRLKIRSPAALLKHISIEALDARDTRISSTRKSVARSHFSAYVFVGSAVASVRLRLDLDATAETKPIATLRPISFVEYSWRSLRYGLLRRPLAYWRYFFRPAEPFALINDFPGPRAFGRQSEVYKWWASATDQAGLSDVISVEPDGRLVLKQAGLSGDGRVLPKVIDAFRSVASRSTVHRAALVGLCWALLEIGEITSAGIVLDDIARQWPREWEVEELRAFVLSGFERFPAARDAFRHATSAMPDTVSRPNTFHAAIAVESFCDDSEGALTMLARAVAPRFGGRALVEQRSRRQLRSDVLSMIEREVRRLGSQWLAPGRRVAAYFLDPGPTLGHAVIEPFYIANLAGQDYDNILVFGPPRSELPTAARVGLAHSCAHLIYLETDDLILRLAGQVEAGVCSFGDLDLLLYCYHGLCRAVFEARLNPTHPAYRGRRYLALAAEARERGLEFLQRRGLGPEHQIVALHIRSHSRTDHSRDGDSFRNLDVADFELAIRYLINRNMLVVRLGDYRSPPLQIDSEQFIDLPRSPDYHSMLDPYFIHAASFMVSSQSGPCAYARAFGTPNLIANAHMFYATLPERQDLLAFRPAFRTVDGKRTRLDANSIVGDRLMRFQVDAAFRDAGISFGSLGPETIRASTQEMIDWINDKDKPESAAQQRFRALCLKASAPDANGRRDIAGGFVGYGLPEARLADAVVAADPKFV